MASNDAQLGAVERTHRGAKERRQQSPSGVRLVRDVLVVVVVADVGEGETRSLIDEAAVSAADEREPARPAGEVVLRRSSEEAWSWRRCRRIERQCHRSRRQARSQTSAVRWSVRPPLRCRYQRVLIATLRCAARAVVPQLVRRTRTTYAAVAATARRMGITAPAARLMTTTNSGVLREQYAEAPRLLATMHVEDGDRRSQNRRLERHDATSAAGRVAHIAAAATSSAA